MKKIMLSLASMLLGALIMGIVIVKVAPGMMIHQIKSPYDVEKTVAVISQNAKKQGWSVKKVSDMQKTMKKKLKKDIPAVKVMKLGQSKLAYDLLKEDKTRFLATVMPHSIAVYETSDGTYISSFNMALMGKIFGGETDRVMGLVQKDDDEILKFLLH